MKNRLTQPLSGALIAALAWASPAVGGPFAGSQPQPPRYQPSAPPAIAATVPQGYYGQPPQVAANAAYGYQRLASQPGAQELPAPSAEPIAPPPPQYNPAVNQPQVTVPATSAPVQVAPTHVPTQSVIHPAPHPTPAPSTAYATSSSYQAGSDCNCAPQAAPSYPSYAAPAADCGPVSSYSAPAAGYYDAGYSCTAAAAPACGGPQWFGGLYGLYMERDNPGQTNIAVLVDGVTTPYHPQPTDLFLVSSQPQTGYAGGYEVRFGSTFGCASVPCGCGTYQPWAWEVGFWSLDEDSSMARQIDTLGGTTRMYGRINYSGIEYDRDGTGTTWSYRPVNDYYEYQNPIGNNPTNNVRVLANRVRQTFQAQNLELNFWRFGAPSGGAASYAGAGCGGYGSSSCGGAYAAGACGGAYGGGCGSYSSCDSCGGYGGCDTAACGCDSAYACGGAAPVQRLTVSGLAGVRYVRFDETFQNATFFTLDSDGDGVADAGEPGAYPNGFPVDDDNVLFHDIDCDNELVGFQLGFSLNYAVSCRWSVFSDTAFGIYGNDISVYQRVFSGGGGDVRFVQDQSAAVVRSNKQDVAFLGEWRLGFGYQFGCNWRATGAWRVLAASGVALAGEQIPQSGFPNSATVGVIDTNDSLVLHGLQAGVECKY